VTEPTDQLANSEQAWYASLPTVYAAAAAVFTDAAGRVLLVKPNYRDHWSLPGGIIEHGEPPHVGCAREIAEELGLDIEPGPLLAIGWTPPEGDRPRAIVHWLFDGGTLDPGREITLQEEELDDYRYVEVTELAAYLPPVIAHRLTAALRARTSGTTAYVPVSSQSSGG